MTKWEYIKHVPDTGIKSIANMGQEGWEAWHRDKNHVYFKRPIEEEATDEVLTNIFPEPDRIVVNDQGEAWPPIRARAAGVYMGAIFIRKDGWSLGAPRQFMDVAESLWADEWLVVICKTDIMPYEVYKQQKAKGFIGG